jgi:carbon-monoxide dehydrogenase iron sulfur subunit
MKKIFAREEYCMGCRLCEIHCITAHSKSKKIIKAYKEEFPRATPRIVVEQMGPLSFALQCRHCEDAPCVEACLTGAMQKDAATGAVKHDDKKCVGCWMCIMACPFGVIKRDQSGAKIVTKCDLCADVGEPVCVLNCPNGALIYKEE